MKISKALPKAPGKLPERSDAPKPTAAGWAAKAPRPRPAQGPVLVGQAAGPAPLVGELINTRSDRFLDGFLIGGDGKAYPPSTPLTQVPAMEPNNGKAAEGTVLLINGIMTDAALHHADMQALANTGVKVVGIHNATRGMVLDLLQCLGEKLNLSTANDASIETTARLLYDSVRKGEPIALVAHSQGALVVGAAVEQVQSRLILEDGMTKAQAQLALAVVKVETFGGAAASFPDGPSYAHRVNTRDLIPLLTGVGLDRYNPLGHLGAGAVVRTFSTLKGARDLPSFSANVANFFARLMDRTTHGLQDVYADERGK